jgi:hypothetical protein
MMKPMRRPRLANGKMAALLGLAVFAGWGYCCSEPSPRQSSGQKGGDASADAGLDAFIARRLKIAESKSIFTLFAMLNVAGYDLENRPQGMHPLRKRLRDRLLQVTPEALKTRVRKYYEQHQVPSLTYAYSVVAMVTSGPPTFEFTATWKEISSDRSFGALAGLPRELREFYAAVPIESIYADVRRDYQRHGDEYLGTVRREVSKAMQYAGVKGATELAGEGELKRAIIIPNLLDSYSHAFSFVLADTFYSVEGPQAEPGYNPHEFIHSITNPISYDPGNRDLQLRAQPLFDAVRELPAIKEDHKTIGSFFDECLVQAIELKYLDTGDPKRAARLLAAMQRRYHSGFVLTRFFYEQLSGYEAGKETLRTFYPKMLARLDVKRELSQWQRDKKS